MFDVVLLLSRYLFLGFLLLFLWQAVICVAYERGGYLGNPENAISRQRSILTVMHITAFLLLAYRPETMSFDIPTLTVGAGGLLFLVVSMIAVPRIYQGACPLIWSAILFLLDIGLIMLQRIDPALAIRQLIWMTIGTVCMLWIPPVLRLIPRFEVFELAYIILSYGLILSTLLFGKQKFGSVNWLEISLGSFQVTFQPSEIVKFLFVFYLASVFRKRIYLKELFVTGILSAGIVLLLVFQKDLGGALIFFTTFLFMLYIATSNWILLFLGMGGASFAAVLAHKLFSHVRVRVMAWQNPWADIEKGGYQIVSSLFAITTFGLMGSGLTKGMPTSIPVVESDFIFAAICEEFGALFGMGLICVFLLIFFRGIQVALHCERRYYSLLAAGIIIIFAFQSFLILGGVIKLIPLTGVTLPFVSYGGSSVFVSILMLGLVQWICVYSTQHTQGDEADEPT